jgi:outer membrane receptor protein involved in Fe transport
MRHILLLIGIFSISLTAAAQKNGSVKGTLIDTISKQPVASATLTLLSRKDSSLVSFTMTDSKGAFQITGIGNGDYRLLITHVNYHGKNEFFSITDDKKQIELGNVVMFDKSQMLNEVVVTAEAPPVTLVGDTVQYNAGSFRTPPNSNVEQLLKKLPGVKVEKDGTIKAQGQEVKRVLVDGKEFFGNDPKIATRNLPADAIDKVQVYDRASDQSQLTGFDDGNSEKTINLKLKKDKKKGWFGKAMAGGGTDDRFEGRFNVNSFKGARQLSAIGMANNTNAEGFSFMDLMNFTGELSRMRSAGGGNISINITDNSMMAGLGGADGNIRTVWGGGLNYNNIIGNNVDFTSNYFYNHYNPKTASEVRRENFLPGSSFLSNLNSITDNNNNTHRLNLGADIIIDSFHSIKINPSFGYQKNKTSTFRDYENISMDGGKLSGGFSDTRGESEGYNFRTDVLFRKKFRQKGRTLSLSVQTSLNGNTGNGSLQSVNEYFDRNNGSLTFTDSLNQVSNSESDLRSYNARLAYTEPIFKKTLLELSVGKSNSISTSEKITYDYNKLSNKFDQVNKQLTNDFENKYGYTTAGTRLLMQLKKLTMIAGVNWQQADLEGKIISGTKDSVISKSFTNLLPNARLQYRFNRYRMLTLTYAASTNQPSVSQLQPVPDISDPFNIREGNPDLKQEYSHMAQLNFMSVNPFKNKNLFAFITARTTNNKIVNYDMIDSVGKRITRPVNVDGVLDLTGDINLGLPLRFLRGTINFGLNGGYSKGAQFINEYKNDINTLRLGPDVRIDISPTETFDIALTAGYSYNSSKYSLASEYNTKFFTQTYGTDMNWQLPKQFFLSTEFTYTINTNRAQQFNVAVPLWNASVSKMFLRYNRGELKLTAFDLLNKNTAISRTATNNYIEDRRTVALQRFFLLSFTYSLTKTGLSSGTGGANFRIIRR